MIPKSDFFLGVDGGGTKTEAVLIDQNKQIVGRGSSGGSNTNISGFSESAQRVTAAAKAALGNYTNAKVHGCLAIAGINFESDKKLWLAQIYKDQFLSKLFLEKPLIFNDAVAALRAGTNSQNAIVIIAGTGSICWGKNEKGQEAKSSGLDWILTDQGSGYAIGSAILHAVVSDIDGRGKKTVLTNLLLERLKINSLEELSRLVYQKPWNKTAIASIAPLAQKAVGSKDTVANSIQKTAAQDLTLMVKAVAKKLSLLDKKYSLVHVGGVFSVQKGIFAKFKKQVKQITPKVTLVKPNVDSATGAAYLALESFTNL